MAVAVLKPVAEFPRKAFDVVAKKSKEAYHGVKTKAEKTTRKAAAFSKEKMKEAGESIASVPGHIKRIVIGGVAETKHKGVQVVAFAVPGIGDALQLATERYLMNKMSETTSINEKNAFLDKYMMLKFSAIEADSFKFFLSLTFWSVPMATAYLLKGAYDGADLIAKGDERQRWANAKV